MAVTPFHGVVVDEVIGIAITAAVNLGVYSVQAIVIALAAGHDAGNQHHGEQEHQMFHCFVHLCCYLLVCIAKLRNMIVIKIHSLCHILNQRTQSHPNTPKIASVSPN